MKYRITHVKKNDDFLPFPKRYRSVAPHTVRRTRASKKDDIDFTHLFEISDLPALPNEPRPSFWERLRRIWGGFWYRVSRFWTRRLSRWSAKTSRKKERDTNHTVLGGALCASFAVLLLSVAVVLFSLTAPYGGAYVSVTVPSLVGIAYDSLPADTRFSYSVTYESNPDVPSGHIISQSPPAGVTRRLDSGNGVCLLRLTVSRDPPGYTLVSLVGYARRDAILELRNHGIAYRLLEAYSDEVAAGTVLFSEPEAGAVLNGEAPVTLTVSKGPRILSVSVPKLIGLSEMAADTLLRATGLAMGQVTYRASDQPLGTVLSQSVSAHEHLPAGSAVDLTVSAGLGVANKTVPSLYGMTREEAERTLHRYGLVLGIVSGGNTTVISQSPAPNTLITAGLVSVDIHLAT